MESEVRYNSRGKAKEEEEKASKIAQLERKVVKLVRDKEYLYGMLMKTQSQVFRMAVYVLALCLTLGVLLGISIMRF